MKWTYHSFICTNTYRFIPSNAIRQIPQLSSFAIHFHNATPVQPSSINTDYGTIFIFKLNFSMLNFKIFQFFTKSIFSPFFYNFPYFIQLLLTFDCYFHDTKMLIVCFSFNKLEKK